MKCVYCEEELKEGCLFCSSCGKDVQIVPDYNEFDDEYLNELVASGVADEKQKELMQKKRKQREAQKLKKRQSRIRLIILFSVLVVLIMLSVAMALLSNLKEKRDNSYDYQVKKAQESLSCGDTQTAIDYLEKAHSIDPSQTDIIVELADLYLKEGYQEAAIIYYKQLLQVNLSDDEIFKKLFDIYDKNGKVEDILQLKLIAKTPLQESLFKDYTVAVPEFEQKEGTYHAFLDLVLYAKENCSIYYSLDGESPIENGIIYERPISLDEEKNYQIQAVCLNDKGIFSDIIKKSYTIEIPSPKRPEVSPDGGSFVQETTAYVQIPKDCVAYYTWDGSNPDCNSPKCQGSLTIPEGNNILSMVFYNVATQKYSDIYRGRFEYFAE